MHTHTAWQTTVMALMFAASVGCAAGPGATSSASSSSGGPSSSSGGNSSTASAGSSSSSGGTGSGSASSTGSSTAAGTSSGTASSSGGAGLDGGQSSSGGLDGGAADDAGVPDGGAGFNEGAEERNLPINVPQDVSAAPACAPPQVTGCLYQPTVVTTVAESVFADDVVYQDALGRARVVPIAVYRAPGVSHAPVVIMSHGGAGGINRANNVMREWASIVSAAGYVVVAVAHSAYSQDAPDGGLSDYDALCAAAGVQEVPGFRCDLKINWARPFDIAAVVQWLENRVVTNAAWNAAVDLSNVAHFGHSAGAGAAMMVGGVTRNFVCAQPFGMAQGTLIPCALEDLVNRHQSRVKAVVAFSPQGPGSDGFMEESYPALAVPMLMGTGLNDGDPGEPDNRLALFPLLPQGPHWKVYLDDPGAKHGLMGGNLDPCVPLASLARCSELRAFLTSSALAFLDGHLRGRNGALAWLASGNLAMVSAGTAVLTPR